MHYVEVSGIANLDRVYNINSYNNSYSNCYAIPIGIALPSWGAPAPPLGSQVFLPGLRPLSLSLLAVGPAAARGAPGGAPGPPGSRPRLGVVWVH